MTVPLTRRERPPLERPRPIVMLVGGRENIRGGVEAFTLRAEQMLKGTGALEVSSFSANSSHLRPAELPAFVGRLRDFRRAAVGADWVWVQYGNLFDLAYVLAARRTGAKVAVTPHLGGAWRSVRNPLLRFVSQKLLGLATRIFLLYLGQSVDLGFSKRIQRHSTVMPTLMPAEALWGKSRTDAPIRATNSHPTALRLVHIARLSREKGTFAFIETCNELSARGVSFSADIIGPASSADQAAIRAAIEQYGLRNSVDMRGPIAPEKLAAELQKYHVLVHLSLQDAYPLIVLEAISAGLVPVCSALPGVTEMKAEFPIIRLVAGQNAVAAADDIEAFFANEGNEDEIRHSQSTVMEALNWDVVGKAYVGIFAAENLGTVGSEFES